jgi:serine/threonine protein kinase
VKELKISELEKKKTELEKKKTELENKKTELENKKTELEKKKTELEKKKKKKKITEKIEQITEKIEQITEEIEQITEEIKNRYNDAKKEAEILYQLSINLTHPNILKYIGCNDAKAKQFYIVTEYNEGYISLFDFINKTVSDNKDGFQLTKQTVNQFIKHFSTNIVSNIIQSTHVMQEAIINKCIRQLYEGLWEIHSRGVFHRDIKPANIIIDPKTGNIKYIDFGLSSTVNDVNNKPDNITFAGTPEYIPYEGKLTIDNISATILDVYLSNDAPMTNVLIYIDYWGLAFTIYIMLFCRKNLFFPEPEYRYDLDPDDERYDNGWDGEGDIQEGEDDIQKGGNNTDSCVDNILDNDIFKYFYTNNQYHPAELEDDFDNIDSVLDPLKIPHYMKVSDILHTFEGENYIENLMEMYTHFIEKYEEMKSSASQ